MSEQTDAKALLKAIDAQILALVSGGVASYSRPGLSLTKLSLGELREMRRETADRVAGFDYGFITTADFSGRT